MIAASCSKLVPTWVPSPAMVSSSTQVFMDGVMILFRASATSASPSSTLMSRRLPGRMRYSEPSTSARRARSSEYTMRAKSRSFILSVAGSAS